MITVCNHTHRTLIEVRYAETDQMGVVHHAVYPVWFEQARLDFFKSLGFDYVMIEKMGYKCPVLKLEVNYRAPTHYGEFVQVETTLRRKGNFHFEFSYKLFVDEKLCSTGSSVHCFLKNDAVTNELPPQILTLFQNI